MISLNSMTVTDILVVSGFTANIVASWFMIKYRTSQNEKDIKDAMEKINRFSDILEEKAGYSDIARHDKTMERIFDQINSKQGKEECKDWRESNNKAIEEIKTLINEMNCKIDKFLVSNIRKKVKDD